ncbi:class I SAM-dependent methyltransferase [Ruegeria sp. 2012CJ41-6]|uniref:Class I SAM-dependent methyltransferase n=1 Tax=Ruegeria spongiae TaxID=2942209 RepID=A0ABT0Q749_9RHOB|nr:class I SAM-dependent methyltransferase [Ruegeria spongiae]MCL6285704.1 class I SAM-dependent methyltransferase [Ruegeria spongiae]
MYEDLLPHDLPTEAERLDRMARAHDPDTFAVIDRLNLPADATCLDIGAGRGSVAIRLAETRPQARVTASDLDLSAVRENDLGNLTLARIDLREDDLGEAIYDLIHCRAVLCFLPTRTDALGHILRALKPGGALVVSEMDFGRIAAGPSRFWAMVWTAYLDFAAAQGWDLQFGSALPRQLSQLGFTEIDARHIQPMLNPAGNTAGAAEAETWSLTLATLAPKLIGGGFMPEAMLTDALDIIRNPGAWVPGPGFMVASARRPSGPA